jgi:glucokinase
VNAPPRDAAAITSAALDGSCDHSRSVLAMFCAILGSVAGNLAVTFSARGGVYIAGGIVPRFPRFVADSEFRERFEAKGRFREYLHPIPTSIIVRPDASFAGLKAFRDHQVS